MSSPEDHIQETIVGPPGDLPRIRDCDQGRPYDVVWLPSINPQGGPPLSGGPVGTAFNCVLRVELKTGRVDALGLPPGMAVNEPVHIPSSRAGHNGWLMLVVDREAGEDYKSELWILDADNVAAGPVAKVHVPVPLRPQVHGWWVPAAELAKSVHKAPDGR
jgi:carotenoid cleavage dioxygenase